MIENSNFTLDTSQNSLTQNTKTDFIMVSEDKLENYLIKYGRFMAIKDAWISPLSLMITFLTTLLATTFETKFLGIKGEVWQALFIMSFILSTVWLIYTLINIVRYWQKTDVHYLIQMIKGEG